MTSVDASLERYLSQYRKSRLDSLYPDNPSSPNLSTTTPAPSESEYADDTFSFNVRPSPFVRLSNPPGPANKAPLSPPISEPPNDLIPRRSSFQRGLRLMGVSEMEMEEDGTGRWATPLVSPTSGFGPGMTGGVPTPAATPSPEKEKMKGGLGKDVDGVDGDVLVERLQGINLGPKPSVRQGTMEDITPPSTPKLGPQIAAEGQTQQLVMHGRKPSQTPYPQNGASGNSTGSYEGQYSTQEVPTLKASNSTRTQASISRAARAQAPDEGRQQSAAKMRKVKKEKGVWKRIKRMLKKLGK